MKGYGLPRDKNLESPDLVDIRKFALKSSLSRVASKSGDIKNSLRSPSLKRRARRVWKGKERACTKETLYKLIQEID